jgi:hypothetical protein
VWGKPAIGTAAALNFTVGAAEATLASESARTAAAATARLMVALRIPVLLQSWFCGQAVLRSAASHSN